MITKKQCVDRCKKYNLNFVDIDVLDKRNTTKVKIRCSNCEEVFVFMKNNGYDRYWDCGNKIYIWKEKLC